MLPWKSYKYDDFGKGKKRHGQYIFSPYEGRVQGNRCQRRHELYKNRIKPSYLAAMLFAAFFPLALVVRMSPLIREWYQLITLRLKILMGL